MNRSGILSDCHHPGRLRKRVLAVGDPGTPELSRVLGGLAARCELACQPGPPLLPDTGLAPPDLILLVQSWPGQWSDSVVNSLHRRWPLARLAILLSSWCEGEPRSGNPCVDIVRLYWYDAERRLAGFLEGAPTASSWHLPRLATDTERWHQDLTAAPRRQLDGLVVVASRQRLAYESLADACQAAGCAVVWQRRGEPGTVRGASVGIWDGESGSEQEWTEMAQFSHQLAPAHIVLVLGFPRWNDWKRASELGAAVIAKPLLLQDLWRELRRTDDPASTMEPTNDRSRAYDRSPTVGTIRVP